MRVIEHINTTNLNKREFDELVKKIANGTYCHRELNLTTDFLYHSLHADNDQFIARLTSALKQNSYIKKISLVNQNITDAGAVLLGEVNTLEEVDLENNSALTKGIVSLVSSKVQVLSLKQNCLAFIVDQSFKEIAEALSKNHTITDLNLSRMGLSGSVIAKILTENTTIKKLTLTDSSHSFPGILRAIEHTKTLQYLDISKNGIDDEAAEIIAKNSSLHILIADETGVSNKGGQFLSTHPTLKVLSIKDSYMTAEGLRCFLNSNLEKVTPDNIRKNLITELELCEFYREFEIMHRIADAEEVTEMGGAVDTLGSEII